MRRKNKPTCKLNLNEKRTTHPTAEPTAAKKKATRDDQRSRPSSLPTMVPQTELRRRTNPLASPAAVGPTVSSTPPSKCSLSPMAGRLRVRVIVIAGKIKLKSKKRKQVKNTDVRQDMNSGSIDVTNALASGSIEQKDTHSYFRSRCERDNGNETRRLEELEMHAPYRISEMIDCFNQLLLVDYAESVRPPGCFRLIAASLSQSSGRHHANMDFARPFCLSARRSLRSLEPPSPRPI